MLPKFVKTIIFLSFLSLLTPFALADESANQAILNSTPQPSDYLGQIILSLVGILILIFASAWLLKRFSAFPGIASGHLRVLGGISVGQREKIILLQAGKEQIVVGVTPTEISFLHELKETVEVEEAPPLTGAFANRLQEAMNRKNGGEGA